MVAEHETVTVVERNQRQSVRHRFRLFFGGVLVLDSVAIMGQCKVLPPTACAVCTAPIAVECKCSCALSCCSLRKVAS